MLLDLSVELLQEIADKLPRSDYGSFRAACKDISFAMDPLFYSSIVLKRQHLRHRRGLWILHTLAKGETGWTRYAKSLRIARGNRTNHGEETSAVSDIAMQGLLASALKSLMNIQTVIWEAHKGVPIWLTNVIFDYLDTLPRLGDLQVQVDGIALPLDRLSGLRSLKMTTPYWKKCQVVQQVSQVVTQSYSSLTTLHVYGCDDWSELWSTMRHNTDLQFRLKDISTNVINPDFLAYIASYSGIEKLTLMGPDGGSLAKSDRLANMFFQTVLPRHAESLVELACSARYEGNWSFGTHNSGVISTLSRLTSLEMSVNSEDVVKAEPPMNAADLLLSIVDHLPALRNIEIRSADAQRHRGVRYGNPIIIRHSQTVLRAIRATVQKFNSYTASSAILHVDRHYYELKPIHAKCAAVESASTERVFGYRVLPD